MLKRLALATALLASSAWAQQEISITAKDIESGAADAKLAELGRQAAATGKEVVINAPKEWHGTVAAKVKAGGAAPVKLNDSFFENVVVRVADKAKAVEPPKPAEAPKPAAPAPAPKPVEAPKPAAPAPAPKPVEAPKAEVPPPPPAPVEAPAPAPVVEAPPPPPKPVEAPKPAAPAVDPNIAIRQRFEQNLHGGKPARGEIEQTQLAKGDIVYIDGDVRAVVRRDSLGTTLYFLNGELNLQRAELKPLAANRYEVVDKITATTNVSLRNTASGDAQIFAAAVPAEGAAERAEMEKLYAEGRPVGRSLRVDQLNQGDFVYLGKSSALVVRRDGGQLARYWLDGSLNTNQVGLQKEKGASGKYKVLSDNIE